VLLGAFSGTSEAPADVLSRILVSAEKAGSRVARSGTTLIENAAASLKTLPADVKAPALAAHVGSEGHWTFVNRAGERFTAAGHEELKRAAAMLAPEAAADSTLLLVLTEDVAFKYRAALKDLPKSATLRIAVGPESYPMIRRASTFGERLYAEVRPNILVELTDRRLFDEALWQLSRTLAHTRIRVIALEAGGPQTLSPLPRLDTATKRALPDSIDPDKLVSALPTLSGQTIVVTGRVDGGTLVYRLASGSEQRIVLKDLLAAADASDVGVIVLQSSAPRQPGTRNWLWQRIDVGGLDRALERATFSDFLDALAAGQGKVLIEANERNAWRTTLRAIPVSDEGSTFSSIGGILSDLASEVAGRVVTSAIEADLPSAERQQELDLRLIPGVPSSIQIGYLCFLLLGVVGIVFALDWWRRIWPPERRESYSSLTGYLAARLVRTMLFALLFMPLVAPVSAPLAFAKSTWETITGAVAVITWPLRLLWRTRST
jgi:hypothetical protein